MDFLILIVDADFSEEKKTHVLDLWLDLKELNKGGFHFGLDLALHAAFSKCKMFLVFGFTNFFQSWFM